MMNRMSLQLDTGEVLAGLVERVTYHNAENGFCVLRARARGHRNVVPDYAASIHCYGVGFTSVWTRLIRRVLFVRREQIAQ
jgi:hypothetical protein